MKIYIMRHGEASFQASSDRQRPLTAAGQKQCQSVCDSYAKQLAEVDVFWVSELLRAQQSATIAGHHVGHPPETKRFLSPDSAPSKVLNALEKLPEDAEVLLVSHQPLVGSLVSLLCEGHQYAPHPFTTAELVCLECPLPTPGLATLSFAARP